VVKCSLCGQEFENSQALGSHLRYVHGKVETPLMEEREEDVEKMLAFFEVLEQGKSPIEAVLSVGVNPSQAERWTRLYNRLSWKRRTEIENLKAEIYKIKEVVEILVEKLDRLDSAAVEMSELLSKEVNLKIQAHERRFHGL
jgi:hypothetical protein